LQRFGITYQLHETTGRGDATFAVKRAIESGFRNVIVAGGDGTLNEVAAGVLGQEFVKSTEVKLGIIPVGTGNDWRRTWGISNSITEAIKIIVSGKTVFQDAGKIQFRSEGKSLVSWFLNVAGCGFDAHVVFAANLAKERGHSGVLTYVSKLITTLVRFKHQQVTIWIDDHKWEVDLFAVLIGIGKFAGNNMKLVPNADPTDGYFDVTLATRISKLKVILNLPKLFNGKFIHLKEVHQVRCKTVRIDSDQTLFLQADGESTGEAPVLFEIIPNALCIFAP